MAVSLKNLALYQFAENYTISSVKTKKQTNKQTVSTICMVILKKNTPMCETAVEQALQTRP